MSDDNAFAEAFAAWAETLNGPREGMTVCKQTRRGGLIWGEIVSVDESDPIYPHFVVDWGNDGTAKTEYPFSAFGDTVDVRRCPVCDSPSHIDCES